jgi:hypothetical protein
MNRNSGRWIAIGLAMLIVALVSVTLGVNLLPSLADAEEKGIVTPWYFTWFAVLLTAAMAIVVAGFLFSTVSRGRSSDR